MSNLKTSEAEIISTFDIAEHLETDTDIQDFLRETTQTGSPSDFIHALSTSPPAPKA